MPWWVPLRTLQEDKCFDVEQGKRFRGFVEEFGSHEDRVAIFQEERSGNTWIKEPDTR